MPARHHPRAGRMNHRPMYALCRKGRGVRKTVVFTAALLLILLWGDPAAAQPLIGGISIDAVSVRSAAGARETRVDLYARVPYSELQFLSASGSFSAQYIVRAEIYRLDRRGRRDGLLVRRQWERSVNAAEYRATQSSALFDASTHSVTLPPGTYGLVMEVEDRATRIPQRRESELVVRDLSGPLAISDLVFIDGFEAESQTIFPRVSSVVGTNDTSIQLFYEVYSDRPRTVRVTREVIRPAQGSSLVRSLFTFWRSDADDVTFTFTENTSARQGRSQRVVEIPLSGLRPGEYIVRVRLEDERGRILAEAEKHLEAEWRGLAQLIRSLDEAIDQLRYIAKDRELRHIKAGSTQEERLARFLAFWERRDPTPGSDRNERMEEYYTRVAHANRMFGRGGEGWKTDRGSIIVLYGEPDQVERFPAAAAARAYEVWHYNQMGKRFLFIDESGRGDFRLRVPVWDERSPIR
jgi:GWxTD domain-containing protein